MIESLLSEDNHWVNAERIEVMARVASEPTPSRLGEAFELPVIGQPSWSVTCTETKLAIRVLSFH